MLTNFAPPYPLSYGKPHVLDTGKSTEPEVEEKFKFNIEACLNIVSVGFLLLSGFPICM